MKKGLDVNNINPFLQSSISIFESVTTVKLGVGKPSLSPLNFHDSTYAIQVGVTGEMKGQVILAMTEVAAKDIASRMMFGMPVAELDEMACSALNELSNMIMGNTATIFSTQGKIIDITPPIAMLGTNVKMNSEIEAIKVPLLMDNKEYLALCICVYEEKDS